MQIFKAVRRYIILICLTSCNTNSTLIEQFNRDLSFTRLGKDITNITFENKITEVPQLNYFNFPYMYNGAGVAVGDIDNDGLQDIYFVGNMTKNSLYRNKGNFQFENITEIAGVSGQDNLRWLNGVSMADVNNDGYLDIYICASGPFKTKRNLLYINNGDLTFTERAKEYGLDDNGYSTQSVFFDYDRDGDLDVYIGAYAPTPLEATNSYYVEKNESPNDEEMDKLYRNNGNGSFTDVTVDAGLTNFGLTLGISVSDLNNDGWIDIYVSNDFNSADYYYLNNGNGTFSNRLNDCMNHTANFGMGLDVADINNDGFMDILQLDMGSSNNEDKKRNMSAMAPEAFQEAVQLGLHYQYMKNNLQLNNGDNTFSEISEIAGISTTNWSWSALFCDLNNDSWKDIFITNGMRRNVNDNDFNNLDQALQKNGKITSENRYLLIDKMPVNPLDNYVFLNNSDLTFKTDKDNWGLTYKGFTQGSAYADLDNDGDLDMVLNNLDDFASIFKNNAVERFPNSKYLKIKLRGVSDNSFGIGTKVEVVSAGETQVNELLPTRGYLSSVEPVIHFGLANRDYVDTLVIKWPNGSIQNLYNVKTNSNLEIVQSETESAKFKTIVNPKKIFYDITKQSGIEYRHHENIYNDFDTEILLPHKMSHQGPALSVGDINGDGLDDFFVGGAMGFAGQFYVQRKDSFFEKWNSDTIEKDKNQEDVSSIFFDVDNDGDMDLYVVSGGNEEPAGSDFYADRLYINNGEGSFVKSVKALPETRTSGSKVKSADYDGDGDLDLFVGGRQMPRKYPYSTDSQILRNDSHGSVIKFTDVTDFEAPMLKQLGMVTDAVWIDFDNDGLLDLVVVGEWMSPKLFKNNKTFFVDVTHEYGLDKEIGWWFSVAAGDMDNDGDQDLIIGNLGLNYKYKASVEEPFEIFSGDFDLNGSNDIILGYYEHGNLFPLRGRQCTSQQMPYVKNKFPTYKAFSKATLRDVLGSEIENSLHYKANNFASTYFRNDGGKYVPSTLDINVQFSSVNTIHIDDFNMDGKRDLILAGNLYESEVETPRNDASFGVFLKNDGQGGFNTITSRKSGLSIKGETRAIEKIVLENGKEAFLIARNEDTLMLYCYDN